MKPFIPTPPRALLAALLSIFVIAARAQSFLNTQLSIGYVGVPYPGTPYISVTGASCWTWSLLTGPLPPGMSFGTNFAGDGGQFFGTPTAVGDYPITLRATCASPATVDGSYVISIRGNADAPPSSNAWTPRGSLGGTVKRLEISPDYAADGMLFASGVGGDLYRSSDRGATWLRIEVNPAELDAEITGLALSPVFSGAGATALQRTVFIATRDYGVWKSTDLGLTFSPASSGLPCDGVVVCPEGFPDVFALAISPNYAADTTVWAVINGPANGGSSILYRSVNGGASWAQRSVIEVGVANHGIEAFYPSPLFASDATLFGLGGDHSENPSTGYGVYRSTDGGLTWTRTLQSFVSHMAFSPDYATDGLIYANVFPVDSYFYVHASNDRGATWSVTSRCKGAMAMSGGGGQPVKRHFYEPQPWYDSYSYYPNRNYAIHVYTDHCDKNGYRALTRGMPVFGYDGGGYPIGNDEFRLKLAPPVAGVRHYWLYGNYGIFASFDDAVSFQPRNAFMHALQAEGLGGAGNATVVAAPGGWLLAESGPSGWIRPFTGYHSHGAALSPGFATDKTLWLSRDTSSSAGYAYFERVKSDGSGFTSISGPGDYLRGLSFAPGFNTATGTAFLAGSNGQVRYSTTGGQTFSGTVNQTGNCPNLNSGVRETDGVAVSPAFATDLTVYAGMTQSDATGMLCRSLDGGATWNLVTTPAGALGGRVAVSPVYNHLTGSNGTPQKTLLFGANNGVVYRSTDGGASWSIPAGLPASELFATPYFSPLYAADGTILLAAGPVAGSRFVPGRRGGLWRSADFGASFAPLGGSDGLKTRRVTGLHFYPGFDGRLSAGSSVLVSTDGAGLWLSSDGGRSFANADDFTQAGRRITLGLAAGSNLYFASQERGIARSADSGYNFTELNTGLPAGFAPAALGASSASTARPLLGLSGNGVWRLDSAGTIWVRVTSAAISNSGTYAGFGEDNTYFYALRSDGTSTRTPKAIGTWSALQAGETSLMAISYNASTGPTSLTDATAGPKAPAAGTTASLWALSAVSGPRWSTDSGTTWTSAPGLNDYTAPTGQTWKFVQALGLNAASGKREVLIGSTTGLWLTRDGGDTWRRMDGAGSGLEATSKSFAAALTSTTPSNTTDILVGAAGSTTGGIYLSGDGGEHWIQVNQGFDPAQLSISTLVKTTCTGCPVQYYSGSFGGGLYTRTLTVVPAPAFPATLYSCYGSTGCACATGGGSGPEQGGQPFKLCGSNFQAGAVVEFDGVPAAGCTQSGGTEITCTGTPAHTPGMAAIRVRNPDTRSGLLPSQYTYVAGIPRVSNLRVAKSSGNAALTWSCASCGAASPARVYRSQNPLFTLYLEKYDGGTGGSYANTGALATVQNYFWRVE